MLSGVRGRVPIAIILLIASVARLWGLDFGLPSPYCRPDEEAVAAVSLSIFARNLNPHFFDWPTLFMYVVASCLLPYFQVGRYLGWFRGEGHFLQVNAADISTVFLIARTLSVISGVASVWLVYRVARRLFDETTAVVAAGFLALAFLHARDSHFGVTDVTASGLILVSFLYMVRFADSGARNDWMKAAAAAGLAASTKYNAAMIVAPAVWLAFSGGARKPVDLAAAARLVGEFVLVMALTFVAASPYVVLAFPEFLRAIRGVSAHLAGGHGVILGRGWTVHLFSSLRFGLGVPLLVAGIAGLAWLVAKAPRKGALMAAFPVLYYVLLGSGLTVFARYIVPLVPFLCLSAAFAVSELGRWIAERADRPRWTPAVTFGIALLVIAPSAWSLWQFDRLLARADSRLVAAEWIAQRFPGGAIVGQVGRSSSHLFFKEEGPRRPSRFKMADLERTATDADVVVVPSSPFPQHAIAPEVLGELLARYEPVVTIQASDSAAGRAYDWQDEFYLPLSGFSGIVRPGPNLTIYLPKGR